MSKLLSISVFVLFGLVAFGQKDLSFHESQIFSTEPTVVSFSKPDTNIILSLKMVHSKHGALIDKNKRQVDSLHGLFNTNGVANKKSRSFEPSIEKSFAANFTNGTPTDNNMAISNDGIIMSAVNSNVRFYNEEGELLAFRTLASIARDAGNFSSSAFDPHTIYDPEADRFILIFLSGYSSSNSNLIVGFSQSSDPAEDWNFYKLPGTVHDNKTWSDYPFMGITHDELFIPVLLWKDGESGWDSEAEDIIWQIDKKAGYAGEKLEYKYYDKIKMGNRLVWNIRPVWGSEKPYGPNMYFVANRAIDVVNDTFFLFEITNTMASGTAELKAKVAISDKNYGIPPSAKQPRVGDSLRTNYADVQGAIYHYGKIHFVTNTSAENSPNASIFYGIMKDLDADEPVVNANIFTDANLNLNYPNIAYAGGGGIDRSFVVNCLHSSATVNPGTSVFFVDRNGAFSDLKTVKEGLSYINVMRNDQERWGDYTGAQRKYNENGVTWLMGSFGSANNGMDSWLAKITNTDPQLGNKEIVGFKSSVYPNPALNVVNLTLEIEQSGFGSLSIYSANGKVVKELTHEYFEAGEFKIQLNISGLDQGVYYLKVNSEQGQFSTKFIKK